MLFLKLRKTIQCQYSVARVRFPDPVNVLRIGTVLLANLYHIYYKMKNINNLGVVKR